jgi:hypothetical protein
MIGTMDNARRRSEPWLKLRVLGGFLAVAVFVFGCGNSGTPNYGGGGGDGASPTVPPDVPRNVK